MFVCVVFKKYNIFFTEPYTNVKISCFHEAYLFQLVPSLYFYNEWPQCAENWGRPESLNAWLTPQTVAQCRQLGFFAVPLTCPYRSFGIYFSFILSPFWVFLPSFAPLPSLFPAPFLPKLSSFLFLFWLTLLHPHRNTVTTVAYFWSAVVSVSCFLVHLVNMYARLCVCVSGCAFTL